MAVTFSVKRKNPPPEAYRVSENPKGFEMSEAYTLLSCATHSLSPDQHMGPPNGGPSFWPEMEIDGANV